MAHHTQRPLTPVNIASDSWHDLVCSSIAIVIIYAGRCLCYLDEAFFFSYFVVLLRKCSHMAAQIDSHDVSSRSPLTEKYHILISIS